MLSRSKRIFGIAVLTLAAATATVAPAHADEVYEADFSLLRQLQGPLCLPNTTTGIGLLDTLLPQLMACTSGAVVVE
ncbi:MULTISPECIES: hypothetical protein [unclassified Nonomuraea]|uniref:hypothetical protein n=1 Tax=unclassified Nonomuraea TaxID=2593643 RepID=UPI0035C25DC4